MIDIAELRQMLILLEQPSTEPLEPGLYPRDRIIDAVPALLDELKAARELCDLRAQVAIDLANQLKTARASIAALEAAQLDQITKYEAELDEKHARIVELESQLESQLESDLPPGVRPTSVREHEIREKLAAWEPIVRAAIEFEKDGVPWELLERAVLALPPEMKP